jgi:mono/diheme cytochrome c family protein
MRSQIHRTIAVMTALTLTGLLAAAEARAQEIYMGTFPQQSGEDLFKNICQGCHMPDAKGAIGAGAYPALADNPRLKAAIYPVVVVLHGQRAMPSFGDSLNDEQIANVINYVRTHFGNHYKDQVTPQAVKAQRH